MVEVSLVKCAEYRHDLLEAAITESLSNIGFPLQSFEKKNVLLKPNLMMASAVEKAIITHPAFFRAAATIVQDHGGQVLLVESPAMESLNRVIRKGEHGPLVEELGTTVPSAGEKGVILNPRERKFRRFEVLQAVLDGRLTRKGSGTCLRAGRCLKKRSASSAINARRSARRERLKKQMRSGRFQGTIMRSASDAIAVMEICPEAAIGLRSGALE